MTSLIEALAWDTEFFGFPIGRVAADSHDLRAAAVEADSSGYRCTYLLVEAAEGARLVAAQHAGFVVVGTRAELAAELSDTPIAADDNADTRVADRASDETWMRALARSRFGLSRFGVDPRFGPDSAARLFEAWVDRGWDGPERHVIALDDAGGFVICALDSETREGVIDLIATAPDVKGGGAALVASSHRWFHDERVRTASVVTQGDNIAALRLYERAGYRMRSHAYWLHRWTQSSVAEVPPR
jgi:dTDP-4-amino-4,6-dideoxy-D-galactose acyltransferase